MKKKIVFILLGIVVAAMAGVGVYGAHYYSSYVDVDTICEGVTIQGVDVGGMTKQQAAAAVDEYVESVLEKTVTLQVGEQEKNFRLKRLGMESNSSSAVEEAYAVGKTGNVLNKMMEVRQVSDQGRDISLTFTVDETKTKKVLKKKGKRFLSETKDAAISRQDGKFVIKNEVNGISIDFGANAEELITVLEDSDWNQQDVVFALDYTVDYAEHTAEELGQIQDELGTFTTSYSGSTSGRCTNVENGAELINGTLLYPGESLSVYEKVAPFTAENGYELAGSYENGKTVQTYGGGICQVSTTLYNAVLRAELNVTERENHSMTVHYVELSEDAAISGTDKDFKFENNLDTPIYIEGTTSGSTITFTIYGKEYRDENRTIEFVSETVSTKSPSVKEVKDSTLEEGKTVVEQEGVTGYTARLWKVVYVDGKEQERVQINSSSYMSVQKIVRVGTKKKSSSSSSSKKKKSSSSSSSSKKKSSSSSLD
ncbi:MAG: VanW family protein [Clostridiales bacterium]|nr:VanW family protein [Clostridiales bacterium]